MDTDDVPGGGGGGGSWITNDFEAKDDDFRAKNLSVQYGDSPLHPVKSQAGIILTEIEKQLASTESKYDAAKERLRYSRFLYQTAAGGSISLGAKNYNEIIDESSIQEIISQSDVASNSPLNDDKNSDKNLACGDAAPQYLDETKNFQTKVQLGKYSAESIEQSPVNTARSFKITPMSNITYRDNQDKYSNLEGRDNFFEQTDDSGRGNFSYEETTENCAAYEAEQQEQEQEQQQQQHQHSYQLSLAKYSQGLCDEFEKETGRVESRMMVEERKIYSRELKSRHEKSTERKFPLNISESVRAPGKIKKSRNEKQRRVNGKILSKEIDDGIGATSKRKRKKRTSLKTSNSRCTTATRDTSHSENRRRRDIKKQKQRAHSTINTWQYTQNNRRNDVYGNKIKRNVSEVVEIYHNVAAKSGSISVVSSKHSKQLLESRGDDDDNNSNNKNTDKPVRIRGNCKLAASEQSCDNVVNNRTRKRPRDDIDEGTYPKPFNNRRADNSLENHENHRQENIHNSNDRRRSGEAKIPTDQPTEYREDKNENKIIQEYENHRHSNCVKTTDKSLRLYDPLTMRNYELPTVASKLKQVHRSYFNRFNFRNIPFVVGTSVAPSYNLGLNIQQALSLIKTRQMMPAGGVTPLLINKVTKGEIPVSTLLGNGIKDYNRDSHISYFQNNPGISRIYPTDEKIATSMKFESFFSPENDIFHDTREETRGDKKIEITIKKGKTESVCSSIKLNGPKILEPRSDLMGDNLRKYGQEEDNVGDSQTIKWQNVTEGGGKGIREVLMNFHDQYEAMIIKFETLEKEAEKSKDKSVDEEIASLKKKLTAKEEEIKAVVGLYQEVMALKHQMRMLHERNSLVCVSTESPGNSSYPQFSIRSKILSPIRAINFYRSGGFCTTRGPSTSTRLAGLLRQIKTFQKQLKSP